MTGRRPGAEVRIDGLRRLRSDLRRLGGDLADLKGAALAAGTIVATAAAGRAPRKTGKLSASLRPASTARGVVVRSISPYAGPIHYGWPARNIEPQPFVSEAAVETEPRWLEVYLAEVNKAVEKIAGDTY